MKLAQFHKKYKENFSIEVAPPEWSLFFTYKIRDLIIHIEWYSDEDLAFYHIYKDSFKGPVLVKSSKGTSLNRSLTEIDNYIRNLI
jgi:hypothetical protein